MRELSLLTSKPYIYVFNCDADELADEVLKDKMRSLVAPAEAIFLDAKFEAELVELGDDDEAREMLAEMGVEEPGLDVLARVGFDTLGLQTYLTAGPKESRAWTIRKGATAPEAAGVIHTDFQKGFIKAEIVSYDDLVAAGSMAAAKSAGKVRMEGKDYVMVDGDVVEFRFNVWSSSASTSDPGPARVLKWPLSPRAPAHDLASVRGCRCLGKRNTLLAPAAGSCQGWTSAAPDPGSCELSAPDPGSGGTQDSAVEHLGSA